MVISLSTRKYAILPPLLNRYFLLKTWGLWLKKMKTVFEKIPKLFVFIFYQMSIQFIHWTWEEVNFSLFILWPFAISKKYYYSIFLYPIIFFLPNSHIRISSQNIYLYVAFRCFQFDTYLIKYWWSMVHKHRLKQEKEKGIVQRPFMSEWIGINWKFSSK